TNPSVAKVPSGGTVVGPQTMTFNIVKTGQARGLATVTASILNSERSFTFSDRDVDFYKCADETGTCATNPSSQKVIAYGANGHYKYLSSSTTGATLCTADTFGGNPSGATNACYLSTYEVFPPPT